MVSKKVTTSVVAQPPRTAKVDVRRSNEMVRTAAESSQPRIAVEAETNAVSNEPLRHPLLNPSRRARYLLMDHQLHDNSFDERTRTEANDNNSPPQKAPVTDRLHEAAMILTSLSDSESRRQLENLWSSLSLDEKAALQRQLFMRENCSWLAPERAFYLFQLFGRSAPLEMALVFRPDSHTRRPQLSLHVGTEDSVEVMKFKPHLIGHFHSIGPWDQRISNMFPSPRDIKLIHSQAVMLVEELTRNPSSWEKTLMPDGKYVNVLITPYSGCYIAVSPDKKVEIYWAYRKGMPKEWGLPDRMIPYYNYHLKREGYQLSFERITFDAFLAMMAQRMVG